MYVWAIMYGAFLLASPLVRLVDACCCEHYFMTLSCYANIDRRLLCLSRFICYYWKCWDTSPKQNFIKTAAFSWGHHHRMDLNQFSSFNVISSAGFPCASSCTPISPISNRLLGSLKLDIGNSPNSALSTHFDSDTVSSALSDSQEQHNCGEIHSGVNSCNSLQESMLSCMVSERAD